MSKHGSDKTAQDHDTRKGGNRMGDREIRHQQNPEDRADKIVERLKAERGEK